MSNVTYNTNFFTPTQITGCCTWVDATRYTGAATVTALTDLAENTSYTVGGTPTWATTNFASPSRGNMPGFVMTNGRFIRALTNTCTLYTHSVFIVGSRANLNGDGWPFVSLSGSNTGSFEYFRFLDNRDNSAGANASFRSIAFNTAAIWFRYITQQTTSPFLFASTYSNLTLNPNIYYGGTAYQSWLNSVASPAAFTTNGNYVMIGTNGQAGDTTTNYWPGVCAELIIYNRTLSVEQRQQVEGYLAWKWGLQASLPAGHPYSSPQSITNTFTLTTTNQFQPNYISGNTLWLDAQDTAATVGNPVTQWTDKSGSGFNATQASANAPTIGSYNGYRTVTFNGTSQRLVSNNTVPTQTHTLIAVHRPAVINGNAQGNTSLFRYQPSGSYIVFPYMNGTTPRGYISIYDGVTTDYANSLLVENSVTTAFNIIIAVISSASQIIYKNGTQQSSATASLSSGTSPTLVIGYYQLNNNEYYQGDLGEMIVYNRNLTRAEQQQVEGYLAWKWGLQASLPSDHPYLRQNVFFFSQSISQLTIPVGLRPAFFTNPASFATLQYWFDASDLSTVSGTGASIQWTNKGNTSGLGNAGNITVSSGTPTTGSVSQNGRNCIGLPTGASLVFSAWFTGASGRQQPRTRFFATRPTQNTQTVAFVYLWQELTAINGNDYCGTDATNGATELAQGQIFNMNTASMNTFANQQNTFVIYTYRNAATAANNRIAFTGSNIPLTVSVAANQYRDALVSTYINANTSPAGNTTCSQDLGEWLSFSSELTQGQTETVEGYLAWKWGIQGNLPVNHPFRNFPPPP